MSDLTNLKDALETKGKAWSEQMATLQASVKEMKSEGGKLSGETEQKLKAIQDDMVAANEIKSEMEKRLGLVETAAQRGGGVGETKSEEHEAVTAYKAAFWTEFKSGTMQRGAVTTDLSTALAAACEADPEFKALARQSEQDGGYFVPPDMSGRIIDAVYETSPMRQVATVTRTSSDILEGLIDTGLTNFEWTGETLTPPKTETTRFQKYRIPIHECAARIYITQQLLEDSQRDIQAWAQGKTAQAFSLGQNTSFVTGDGAAKPRGWATYDDGGQDANGVQIRQTIERIKTGVAGDLTDPDVLKKIIYSHKQANRSGCSWALNRDGIYKVSILQMDDKYVWQPGLQAGEPDRLLGYPVTEMGDIPAFVNGAIVGAFADFKKSYEIVDRIGMSVLFDPYTMKPFIEIYSRARLGGDVIDFDTIKVLEASA